MDSIETIGSLCRTVQRKFGPLAQRDTGDKGSVTLASSERSVGQRQLNVRAIIRDSGHLKM